jgi:hypothetical protein
MRNNPGTNRVEQRNRWGKAAGGKLVSLYGTISNEPSFFAIFDVPDSTMGPAIAGVV